MQTYFQDASPTLARAERRAIELHDDQTRKTGEPFVEHPQAIALRLWELWQDEALTVAALLHDTVEDTVYSFEDLEAEFGYEVACLVDGVTKTKRTGARIPLIMRDDPEPPSYGHATELLLAVAERDARVLILKLADRSHNLVTLSGHGQKKQIALSIESQALFSPLCDILDLPHFFQIPEDFSPAPLEAYDERWKAYLQTLEDATPHGIFTSLVAPMIRSSDSAFYEELRSDPSLASSVWEVGDEATLESLLLSDPEDKLVNLIEIESQVERGALVGRFQFKSGSSSLQNHHFSYARSHA